MPIQPLNVSSGNYNQIPDAEDVTPVDNSIAKKVKRSFKAFAVVIGCCVVIAAILACAVRFTTYSFKQPVQIFQTSMGNGDRLKLLSASDMAGRGYPVKALAFGNVKCSKSLGVLTTSDEFCSSTTNTPATVAINSAHKFQEIVGFGGAFTEASAYNFFKLPPAAQKKVIDLYYGVDGIGYTLGRVHIGSCDFSLKSYNFNDIAGDYSMTYFDTEVTHDNAQMLPLMRLAIKAAKEPLMGSNKPRGIPNGVNILASPWSPPPWMKQPVDGAQNMTGSAVPHGLLNDPKVQAAYALYLSKFLTAYENKGVPIWAITPQNEPEFAAPWEACAYDQNYEKDFINQYLGPTLEQNHPDVLILAFDHNKDHLLEWAETIMGGDTGPNGGYVDGMAFHWYTGSMDRLMDGTYGYDTLNATHHFMPNKMLLGTEGCSCSGVKVDDWLRAERLAHDVIFDMNNYAQGWIDWNILVDSEGGPNHLGNNCDAPIFTLEDFSDIHVQPKYYYFGHISKYVPPGSVRIESNTVGDFGYEIIDPNVRAGMEIGLFSCEKSIRQMWRMNSNSSLELFTTAIDTVALDGYMARLCIGPGDPNRPFLTIIICEGAARAALVLTPTSAGQLVDLDTGLCVTLAGGVREPGALLKLSQCLPKYPLVPLKSMRSQADEQEVARLDGGVHRSTLVDFIAADHQVFVTTQEGEVKSKVADMCITAGWPMLTSAAFKNTDNEIVVVVLNEATVGAEIILRDSLRGDMKLGISPRSMQTIIY